jgi:hypothetical protein
MHFGEMHAGIAMTDLETKAQRPNEPDLCLSTRAIAFYCDKGRAITPPVGN